VSRPCARRRAASLTPVGTTIAVAGLAVDATTPPLMTGHGCQTSIRFKVSLNERMLAQFQTAPGRCLIVSQAQVRKWRHSGSKSESGDTRGRSPFSSPRLAAARSLASPSGIMNGCTVYLE
jgi:hypothetical protein